MNNYYSRITEPQHLILEAAFDIKMKSESSNFEGNQERL